MPSWARGRPARVLGRGRPLRARERPPLRQRRFRAAARASTPSEQIALAREFAHELTDEEHLPYTLAIHAGRDEDGHEHNPHAHLMFSERRNDGIERSRDEWFRRAEFRTSRTRRRAEEPDVPRSASGSSTPASGGRRSRTRRSSDAAAPSASITGATSARASTANPASTTVRPPRTSSAAASDHDRLDEAPRRSTTSSALRDIDEPDRAAGGGEGQRSCAHGLPDEDRNPNARDYSHSSRGDRSDDQSWER